MVVYTYIKGGFWYENSHQKGLFHLLEHCIHNKTKKFKSLEIIEQYKQYYGIETNANTSNSDIFFSFSFPRKYYKQAFNLIEQYLFAAKFTPESLEKEKQVIKQEFLTEINNADYRFSRIWHRRLFGYKHLYTQHPEYDTKLFSKYTVFELENLYKKYFQPQHMVFGIAGNLKLSQVVQAFENLLSPYKNFGIIKHLPIKQIKTNLKPLLIKDAFDSTSVSFSWIIPSKRPHTVKDYMIHNLSRFLLADSTNQNSYLIKRIRHMHKLVYSAGYSVNDYIKHELFTIWAYCDSNNIAKIKKIIKETINEASKKEITIQDLKTAVRFYNIRTLMANDSIANLAYYTASELFFENRYTPLTTYEHLSQSIKPEEIKQYLASFLSIDTALVAIAKKMEVDD